MSEYGYYEVSDDWRFSYVTDLGGDIVLPNGEEVSGNEDQELISD